MRPAARPIDEDAKRRELAALGVSPEQADAYLAQLLARADPAAADVALWDEDARVALEVFCRCQMTVVGGPSGMAFMSPPAREVDVAARACGVPLTAGLLDDVAAISRGAAQALNGSGS
jgi:hypothetical protein